ncbi:MAG TPA: hypothetical protein VJS30_21940, partial [Paraburkholderia sp.]|nr:hypothetical protein [Paraburkholderia sp.]
MARESFANPVQSGCSRAANELRRNPGRSRDADTDPMTTGFLQKIFGSRNQRLIKQYQKKVAAINALEP